MHDGEDEDEGGCPLPELKPCGCRERARRRQVPLHLFFLCGSIKKVDKVTINAFSDQSQRSGVDWVWRELLYLVSNCIGFILFYLSCFFLQLSFRSFIVWKKNQLDDPWLHMWAECCSKFVQLLKWAKFDFDQFSWQLRDEWESEKAQKKVQKIENEEKLKKYSQWK